MSREKEQRAWDALKAKAVGRLLLKRVENSIGSSMPDVIGENKRGTAFWLEMKALHEWPKRTSTCPLARAFEPGQVAFAKEWTGWSGYAFILLRIGQPEWLLLGPKPRQFMGKELVDMTRSELIDHASANGLQGIIEHLEDIK